MTQCRRSVLGQTMTNSPTPPWFVNLLEETTTVIVITGRPNRRQDSMPSLDNTPTMTSTNTSSRYTTKMTVLAMVWELPGPPPVLPPFPPPPPPWLWLDLTATD